MRRDLLCVLLFAACGAPAPAQEAAPAPVAHATPAQATPADDEVSDVPREAAAIAPPIAVGDRLTPCAVVLVQTTFDEETKAPTVTRHTAERLVRVWDDALRESEWRGVAPIPLTAEQARALLPAPQEHGPAAGGGVFATVGDGTLSYRFDEAGRTASVEWDPTADSATYEFQYAYDCAPTLVPPPWGD